MSCQLSDVFCVLQQCRSRVATTDHSQPTRLQDRCVSTAIQYCWRIFLQPFLEPPRVCCIHGRDDPDSPGLPAFDRLAQQEASAKQPLQAVNVHDSLALSEQAIRISSEKIARTSLHLVQEDRKMPILTRRQQVRRWLHAPSHQGCREQQDRLAVL